MIPTDYLPYPLSILHDFAAPFVQPVKAQYTFSYVKADQEHQPTEVQALAVVKVQPGKYEKRYQLLIKESGVQEIICEAGKKNQWVIRCSEA
jgi:hypothetical protein